MKQLSSFIEHIFLSLDNSPTGASARKLTAFTLMFYVGYLHIKFVDQTNSFNFLVADLISVGVMLGLVTAEQLIKFKNDK